MPIHFRCPHCEKLLALGTHKGGTQIHCPMCDHLVTVPPRTEVELPTTTVVPADPAPPPVEAWWLSAGPPPLSEAITATAVPAPVTDPLVLETAPKPTAASSEGTITAAGFFTRQHGLILAGGIAAALAVIAGALALLPGRTHREKPQPAEQTALVGDTRKEPEKPREPSSAPPSTPKTPATPVREEKPSQPDKPTVREKKDDKSSAPPPPAPPKNEALQTPTPPVDPAPVEVVRKPAPARPLVVKYRRDVTEDELRRQIEKAPEVALDRGNDRTEAQRAVRLARAAAAQGGRIETTPRLMLQRADLAGLPMRMGDECHLGPATADHLQGGSLALRAHLLEATRGSARAATGDTRPDPKKLYAALTADGERHNKWLKPEAVPALQQLLMAENESIREVLVDQLARIDGKRASVALAQRALFDLHAGVRKSALMALRNRPRPEYQAVLLDGFLHPWSAVADHAAEALVALGMRDVVPVLLSLLDQPNPAVPYRKPGKDAPYVREMVRINHLRNCVLCHAPSLSPEDKVRGFVPPPSQHLAPGPTGGYGGRSNGIFVRADVTYLQQDFSVPLTVKDPGKWPAAQRYDFLVRERPATPAEVQAARATEANAPSVHQKALFFALRELTGADPGPTVEDWKRLFLHGTKVTRIQAEMPSAAGVIADDHGRVWVSVAGELRQAEPVVRLEPWSKDLDGCKDLALDGKGRLLACQTARDRLVAVDLAKRTVTVLADRYKGQPLHAPTHLVVDRQGGVYFTDAAVRTPSAGVGVAGAVYYLSARGTLSRLPISLPAPGGIGLSPDEKTLYLASAGGPEVMAYSLEGVGLPGKGKVLCRLQTRSDAPMQSAGGLAVDRHGNLFVANPAMRAIQVLNSEGARLGLISLPDAPRSCAVGGPQGKSLYVTTHHALFKIELETAGAGLAARER